MVRSRTFEWLDPRGVSEQARRLPGIEFLQSIAGRDRMQAAPIGECLAFQLTEVEAGRVTFELTPAEYHYNPIGAVHGGVIASLCDAAAGAAVHSTLAGGTGYTSLEIKVSFLRAVTIASGPMRCEGRVISQGKRVAVSEARLVDGDGKLYAHATSTCLILPPDGR